MTDIITITDAARDHINKLLWEQYNTTASMALRLGVEGGGCSGLQYKLGLEELEEGETDKTPLINGIYVLIDPKSALYLAGATVDYIESLMASGFKIDNPNAQRHCGCGQSFS